MFPPVKASELTLVMPIKNLILDFKTTASFSIRDVTTKRLYLETMEEVLRGMNKVVIDSKGGQGVVPYLPLPELQKKGGN